MASITFLKGKGWRNDIPDFRDHTPSTCKLCPKQKAGASKNPVSAVLKDLIEKNSSGQKKDSLIQKNICVNGVHPSKTNHFAFGRNYQWRIECIAGRAQIKI